MRRLLYISITIAMLFACNKTHKLHFEIDKEPAEKFLDVMNYIQEKSPTKEIPYSNSATFTTQENIEQDSILAKKIDNLLSLPTYKKLASAAVAYNCTSTIYGAEAYKLVLNKLPYNCIKMNNILSDQWVTYWNNGYNKATTKFLNQSNFKSNLSETIEDKLTPFLPANINADTINITFCFDGSNGTTLTGNNITFDLIDYSNKKEIESTLIKEIHQFLYSKWLNKNFKTSNSNYKREALRRFQNDLIIKGVPQVLTFNELNNQSKKLYNNPKLLEELFKNWMKTIREIYFSSQPIELQALQHENAATIVSFRLLRKYCTDKTIEDQTIYNRPIPENYIGYYIYNSILTNSGQRQLKRAIANPDKLIDIYNNSVSKNSILPKIPEDIKQIWEDNYSTKSAISEFIDSKLTIL